MNLLKTSIGIILALASIFYLGSNKEVLPTNENPHLVVGTHPGYAPFESVDFSGNVVGFDIDLAEALAKELGKTLVVKQGEFDSLILGLKHHRYDCVLAGMSITPQRLQEVDMLPYHGEQVNTVALTFWGDIPDIYTALNSHEEMSGMHIAVQYGTWHQLFCDRVPGIITRHLEGNAELVMELQHHKVDAVLFETGVYEALQQKMPELQAIILPLPEEWKIYGSGIALKKGNALSADIEQALEKIKEKGVLTELENKWFKGGSHAPSS